MKNILAVLSVSGALALSTLALGGCAHHDSASSAEVQSGAVDLNNTICPVSGDPVGSSKLTETYQGKIYHFCCADCPKTFKANPDKYAQAVAANPTRYGVKR